MSDSENLRRNTEQIMADGRARMAEARQQIARSDQLRQSAEAALEHASRLLPSPRDPAPGAGPEPAE